MAYNKDELIKKSLEIIEKYKPLYIEELVAWLPCSKPTFYEHKLNESDKIKEAMFSLKVLAKAEMREQWKNSENATLQLARYKLLSNEDELDRLNNNANGKDKNITINLPKGAELELE